MISADPLTIVDLAVTSSTVSVNEYYIGGKIATITLLRPQV